MDRSLRDVLRNRRGWMVRDEVPRAGHAPVDIRVEKCLRSVITILVPALTIQMARCLRYLCSSPRNRCSSNAGAQGGIVVLVVVVCRGAAVSSRRCSISDPAAQRRTLIHMAMMTQ